MLQPVSISKSTKIMCFTQILVTDILSVYSFPDFYHGEPTKMAVDAKSEILIERPRDAVAKVMFDPKFDKLWITGLTHSFPQSPGLLAQGAKFERVGSFLGRHYSAIYLVTRNSENEFIEIAADEPFQMKIRYELGETESGTLTKIRIQSIGENLYQVPPAVLNRSVQDWISGDLERLKKRVEQDGE